MNNFFVGLQFLTSLKIVKQTEWSLESFGKSVKYFPLIGAVLGIIMASFYFIAIKYLPLAHIYLSHNFLAILLFTLSIILTGALHCDGFMDTADGVFSGRSKDRMLEIMKDSCVGSNAVVAFFILSILKIALFMEIPSDKLLLALFAAPILSRFNMVIAITKFPYARPDGMGKAFAEYSGTTTFYIALLLTMLLIIPLGKLGISAFIISCLGGLFFCNYFSKILGGLTGDTYGAITELCEVIVLCCFLIIS